MDGPRTNTSVCRQGSISKSTDALISKEIIKRFVVAIVWALTPCCLATSGTARWSASLRIVTICASVNRVFFMAPSWL